MPVNDRIMCCLLPNFWGHRILAHFHYLALDLCLERFSDFLGTIYSTVLDWWTARLSYESRIANTTQRILSIFWNENSFESISVFGESRPFAVPMDFTIQISVPADLRGDRKMILNWGIGRSSFLPHFHQKIGRKRIFAFISFRVCAGEWDGREDRACVWAGCGTLFDMIE